MTREEAIEKLEAFAPMVVDDTREAIDMAIEALAYQNISKPNNTCEVDLISREDAMSAVQDHFNADGFKGYYDGQQMMDRINALPSAEPKTGEWVNIFDNTWECTNCETCEQFAYNIASTSDYCPNCGAKMNV